MATGDRLLGLIQQLYAAPGTTDGWYAFLESLRVATHGSGTHLICHDPRSRRAQMMAHAGSDTAGITLYQQHWSAYDPWAHSPKQAAIGEGAVSAGDELIDHSTFTRTSFYADFARHYDLVRLLGGVLEKGPAGASVISVNRSERLPPFDRHDVAFFEALIPHVQRALQVHRRLTRLEGEADDLRYTIDRSSRAVFLIDADGRIIFANRAASTLVSMRDGLTLERGELRAAGAADMIRLRTLLAGAVRTSSCDGLASGGVLAVGRPSGRRSFHVLVCPVSAHRAVFPDVRTAAAIVFVTDPEEVAVLNEATLGALFGLTSAEAKLASLIAQGTSLKEAGARLGLRRETARSRLKTIFEKTNTHRQAELVRLVVDATPRF